MLTVIGEALVDVVQRAGEPQRAHVGGSPLNVAVGLARLGHPTQFIGRYGQDPYGDLIEGHLRSNAVLTPWPADTGRTSVAAARLRPDGSADYDFDLHWELPGLLGALPRLLAGTTLVHTGSIATMLDPGARQVLAAVEHARPAATIGFDPNCRPSIITDVDHARERAERFAALADVVKASDEDLAWLYPDRTLEEAAAAWLDLGPGIVVVTRGADGPWAVCRAGSTAVPGARVDVVDTVGAGDSFMAALLSSVVDRGWDGSAQRDRLAAVTVEELGEILRFCTAAAGVTVSRAGANPPTRHEVPRGH
ncbi:carbohydrate kinase [Tersicoccus sp. Bi-70]|uniref:carbohydrate kinase family protein n=1 Tax=Tersicoccus sp. Bi-70 TaxID=1897634 RepID=UPI000977C73A|nr:carbohydrate kinase [Tersicoccus sp. Bi-70]OMH32449.1 ribokinase [Tersicoccus sp. Bi-70]